MRKALKLAQLAWAKIDSTTGFKKYLWYALVALVAIIALALLVGIGKVVLKFLPWIILAAAVVGAIVYIYFKIKKKKESAT